MISAAINLVGKRWYLGKLSHKEAVSRLMEDSDRSDGSYVVYDHPDRENSFVLLVWHKDEIRKWSINGLKCTGHKNMEFVLGKDGQDVKRHSTVKALIKYHRGVTGKPIQLADGTHIGTLKKSQFAAGNLGGLI